MKSKKLIQTFQIGMSLNEEQILKVSRKFESKCVFYRPEYSDFFSKNEDSWIILAMYTWFYPHKLSQLRLFREVLSVLYILTMLVSLGILQTMIVLLLDFP